MHIEINLDEAYIRILLFVLIRAFDVGNVGFVEIRRHEWWKNREESM